MTSAHPVRRLLQRVCSADTMSRVVDPTLGDVRWEHRRPAWLGYLVLARALTVHAVLSTPSALSRTWSDDDRAIPRAALFTIAAATVGALLLELPPFFQWTAARNGSAWVFAILLAPQALVLTLPAALLLAIPLAFSRHEPSGRLARRTIALAIGCVAATFVLLIWIMPEADQAFRVWVSGQGHIVRGVNETGLAALREKIAILKLTPGGSVAVRSLEHTYQLRLVLICVPIPLSVLALAIARSRWGRRRPWLFGFVALAGYAGLFFPAVAGSARLMRDSSLPPSLFAWTPIVLLTVVALSVYSSTPALPDSSTAS